MNKIYFQGTFGAYSHLAALSIDPKAEIIPCKTFDECFLKASKDPKSKLIIGDNVLINSWNTGYHLSMFMPVKLLLHSNDAILEIGDNTRIHGSCLHVKYHIAIGKNCLIAANTQIFDCNGHLNSMSNPELRLEKKDMPKKIMIEDNVWIGTGCIILPGTHIGRGTIISAGSVVSGTIPEKSIAKGNPAVVLKKS